jgi:2-dehydropantoate 2-reductase
MRIAIVGAGGVGGYYGALLAAAGNDVHFIARGPHLRAMLSSGLWIRSPLGDLHIQPVQASDQPNQVGPVDLALFCTKAFSSQAAAEQGRPLVGIRTIVLSLQNGVEAAAQFASILGPQHIIAGATWISSVIEAPGVVKHMSASRRVVVGELDGRESPRVRLVQRVFSDAGISAEVSSNIQGVLWEKLLFISAVAAFGSLTRLPIAAYRSVPPARELLTGMMQETAAVAAAHGVHLEPNAIERTLQYVDSVRPEIKASMQLDVEAGRASELDAIVGVIVRKGRELGIATPIASSLYALLLPMELQAK